MRATALGLLVLDEPFDTWKANKVKFDYGRNFDEWWKRDISAMVLRDRNHPSIVIWGIGNEIPELLVEGGLRWPSNWRIRCARWTDAATDAGRSDEHIRTFPRCGAHGPGHCRLQLQPGPNYAEDHAGCPRG
jgi:beta-galactosidase/beta-glucuronidase